jgi:hypothetical protein
MGVIPGLKGRKTRRKFLRAMTPETALEKQINLYRAMTCEERVKVALRLHDLACEMARLGIRRQHPNASPTEVNQMLRYRLELARTL